jgi:formate dehydrogenase maturation protein FdhE
MKPTKYDLRIARADHLARENSFAAEALSFFKTVSELQAEIYSALGAHRGAEPAGPVSALRQGDLPADLLPGFPGFLSRVGKISPQPLANSARRLQEQSTEEWKQLFASCWQNPDPASPHVDPSEVGLGRMFLQPFAEHLAEQSESNAQTIPSSNCPFCYEKPLVGVLRPEGDGGKRSLICSMCATEWPCGRILCVACGEHAVEKLAVFSSEQFAHVRIEACDTCHRYIKTVDLTKTGRAVPVVDELATLPLNLWAADQGYTKLQNNLLGL